MPDNSQHRVSIDRHGPRRQHAFHGDDARRDHARPAAVFRLGAELQQARAGLVGQRPPDARGLDHAARPVRLGAGFAVDRFRQRGAVRLLRADLVRRAGVRPAQRRSRRWRSSASRSGCWPAACRHSPPSVELRVLVGSGIVTAYTWAHGLRILARPRRGAGVALARDLHAVRARRAVPAAHAARRARCMWRPATISR